MEFLTRQFKQIGLHLSGMTGSQRLALGLSIIVTLMGAASLVHWAGQPDLVPLLDQPMKAEELRAIETQLRGRGERFESDGTQILVRDEDRTRLQGMVAQSGLMPADTSIGFAKLIEQSNLWIPRDESRWQRTVALGNELAKVIAHFDGVTEARVFIDQPERRGFGEGASHPTASVFLQTRPGVVLDKSRTSAIAALVSGAIHGLKPEAVRIVDATSGRPYRVPSDDQSIPFDLLDLRRQKEEYIGRKILAHLGFIPGVLVGVNVEMESEHRREHTEKFGPPVASEEESRTSETQGVSGGATPGARPNTRAAIAGAGSSEVSTTEETRTSLLGDRDRSVTDVVNTPGVVRRVTASVNIPRSYFVGVFEQLNGGKKPESKDLEPLISEEIRKIRGQVKQLISATSDAQVEVSWFVDAPMASTGVVPDGMGAGGVAAMASEFGKPALLAALAIVSLVSVWRMARKIGPVAPGPGRSAGGTAAASPSSPEGSGAEAALRRLEAKRRKVVLPEPEVDPRTLLLGELTGTIGEMVNEEPELAAAIVERWISAPR